MNLVVRCSKVTSVSNPKIILALVGVLVGNSMQTYQNYYKQYRQANQKRISVIRRRSHLKIKYGIDLEKYNQMFEEQRGLCAICEAPPEQGKPLQIDHDHKTGEIRALLCFTCNNGLGCFSDEPELLRKAAAYLDVV